MPTVLEVREQRANVWAQMNEVMELAEREGRELTAEERQKYEAAEADLDRLGDQADQLERHARHQAEMGRVDRSRVVAPEGAPSGDDGGDRGEQYRDAFLAYVRGGLGELDGDARKLLRSGYRQATASEARAAGVGTGSAGGYTVPAQFRNKLVETLADFGAVRRVADHVETATGASLPWPTVDDTANEGAILGENTQASEQDVTFGNAQLDAYKYTSKIVRVSLELLQDNGVDLETRLPRMLGARIGRRQNRDFTVGTGSSQPNGIVTAATVGKQGATGQTTTVTYDDLVDLIDSLDAAYLGGDNLGWMLSQNMRKAIRKLKDSTNRPLWEPSIQAGVPDQMLGYGITLNNHMPAAAANAKTILFGDFREGYVVRDVSDVVVLRLEERYADYGQVGFIAFQRSDGDAQNTAAYKAYQHSAT